MDLYMGLRKQNATQANIIEQERQFETRVSLIRSQQEPENEELQENDPGFFGTQKKNSILEPEQDYDYILPDSPPDKKQSPVEAKSPLKTRQQKAAEMKEE